MPIVDVDPVFDQGGQLHHRHLVLAIQRRLQIVEVALHLRDQALPPPVGEVLPVGGQHRIQVGADLLGVLRIVLGNPGHVAVPVLHRLDLGVGIRRYSGGVEVPVHVLGDPVGGERGPEAAEHVVAGEPPAADVEVHRGERLGAVQVVVDPEQPLFLLRVPLDREFLVAEELLDHFARVCHWHPLLSSRLSRATGAGLVAVRPRPPASS